MLVNRSAPPGPIVPRLIYEDVSKAIDWLCGAFGFTERLRTPPEPSGAIHHAQLAVGAGSIILTAQSRIDLRPPQPNEYIESLMVHVDDVDAHFKRARQYGARITAPPATHPYGERQYSAEDLQGYHWTFSQSVADVHPDAWGANAANLTPPPVPRMRPSFCYIEIPAQDVQQSVAFYEKVFGWNIRRRDSERPSFDDASGHISGAWATGRNACTEPGLLPYVWVDDLDATVAQAAAAGAVIVQPPHPDEPGGASWIATFRDPAGNVIGLYQEDHAAT
jgi:uncharacterized glyoxalase superfamily protein PhnB